MTSDGHRDRRQATEHTTQNVSAIGKRSYVGAPKLDRER